MTIPSFIRSLPIVSLILVQAATSACLAGGELKTVPYVDLNRYMGDWYVIANIPSFLEKGCYAAVETYRMRPDGEIDNFFECRKDRFDGELKRLEARAWVVNAKTQAEWRVKFFWWMPAADYLVLEIDPEYQYTVVGHPSRNYVWIMARSRTLPESLLNELYEKLKSKHGYDTSKILRVPQLP